MAQVGVGVVICGGQGVIILEVGGVVLPLDALLVLSCPAGTWLLNDAVGGVGDDMAGWMATWWGVLDVIR